MVLTTVTEFVFENITGFSRANNVRCYYISVAGSFTTRVSVDAFYRLNNLFYSCETVS